VYTVYSSIRSEFRVWTEGLRVMVEAVRGRQRGGLTRPRCVIAYYVCHYSFVKTLLG
jgi:hypothetical protein